MMGSWIILLLAQTLLVASGRIGIHRQLGLVSFALVPAIVIVMILVTRAAWANLAALPPDVLPAAALASTKALVANVLLEQLKVLVLFPAVRRLGDRRAPHGSRDAQAHDDPRHADAAVGAIDRIALRWLPTNFPGGYEAEYGYLLVWLVPVSGLRLGGGAGRVHRAYVIGIACNVPFFVLNHFLWGSPRWLESAPAIMSVVGVSGW